MTTAHPIILEVEEDVELLMEMYDRELITDMIKEFFQLNCEGKKMKISSEIKMQRENKLRQHYDKQILKKQ